MKACSVHLFSPPVLRYVGTICGSLLSSSPDECTNEGDFGLANNDKSDDLEPTVFFLLGNGAVE